MQIKEPHRDTVSYSEISTWKTCRQKWYWKYVRNLEPISVSRTLKFGILGHVGLMAIALQKDWSKAIDCEAEKYITEESMCAEDVEDAITLTNQVKLVLSKYLQHYANDSLRPIEVEGEFNIPIMGVRHRCIGYKDLIARDRNNDLWLVEHKFVKQFRSFEDTELSTQLGIYQYAAMKAGAPVVGILYNQILAKAPAIPKVNKDGTISRSTIYTDWPTYEFAIKAAGQDPADYLDMKEKLQDKEFFRRYRIFRNQQQVLHFRRELASVSYDILAPKKNIYMCDNAIHCRSCSFRELCTEVARGRDPQHMVDAMFREKTASDRMRPDELEDAVVVLE